MRRQRFESRFFRRKTFCGQKATSNDDRHRTACRSKDITGVQIAGKSWRLASRSQRSIRKLKGTISVKGSYRIGFVAQALVIFPPPLKTLRKGLFHCGLRILPLQFFQIARHFGRDLIESFAAISGVESRFEAQEVEFLAVSKLLARF